MKRPDIPALPGLAHAIVNELVELTQQLRLHQRRQKDPRKNMPSCLRPTFTQELAQFDEQRHRLSLRWRVKLGKWKPLKNLDDNPTPSAVTIKPRICDRACSTQR